MSGQDRSIRVSARAVVRLEIEVTLPGTWSGTADLNQIDHQSREAARDYLRTLELGVKDKVPRIRILGTPAVVEVISTALQIS